MVFRCDSGVAIGTGHVMRCLALAQAWQDAGGAAVFATATITPAIEQRLGKAGFGTEPVGHMVGSAADARAIAELAARHSALWVVVDGYQFGAEYQRQLKSWGLHVLVIDDLGSIGQYWADVVLDQNASAGLGAYTQRQPYTKLLLGLQYCLLRREFVRWRQWSRRIVPESRHVLVTMGGSDPGNLSSRVLDALEALRGRSFEFVIVGGGSNPSWQELEQRVRAMESSVRLVRDADDMPELMAWADIAIIAGGGTLWELLFMQCAVISYARNDLHETILAQLAQTGAVHDAGRIEEFSIEALKAAIVALAADPVRRQRVAELGRRLVPGFGAEKVCQAMTSEVLSV